MKSLAKVFCVRAVLLCSAQLLRKMLEEGARGNAAELGRAVLGWRTSIQGMAQPPVATLLPAHPQVRPWLLEPLLCQRNGAEQSLPGGLGI